jgi:hypothetical protein
MTLIVVVKLVLYCVTHPILYPIHTHSTCRQCGSTLAYVFGHETTSDPNCVGHLP